MIHGRSRPLPIGRRGRVAPGKVLVVELDARQVVRLEVRDPVARLDADDRARLDADDVAGAEQRDRRVTGPSSTPPPSLFAAQLELAR